MEVPTVTWDDVGGLENVKRELQELVQVSSHLCKTSSVCVLDSFKRFLCEFLSREHIVRWCISWSKTVLLSVK